MDLVESNEKCTLFNIAVNQRILSLDFNSDEFYSDAMEKNDGYEWKQMFISKLFEIKKDDENYNLVL